MTDITEYPPTIGTSTFQNQDPPCPSISEADKNTLEMAKLRRQLAQKEAEKSLAQNEAADIAFKYFILQLYMKYNLNMNTDAIDEGGIIHRGVKGSNGQ